jgi:DNA-binding GntR family transcriptional regulator
MARQIESAGTAGSGFRPSDARRASKADQVYDDVKEAILSGVLEPGTAIDKLALSERLGMSRFPITTAINRLAYERLVVIEPQHGSFVAKLSVEDVREWMLIRRALEAEIAADAAASIDPDSLGAIERNLRYQQAAVEARDYAGLYSLDVEFHQLIIAGARLRHAREILDGIRAHLERIRRLLLTPPGRLPNTLAEHRRVAEALHAGDAETARLAMRSHLVETTQLFETFAKEHPSLFFA